MRISVVALEGVFDTGLTVLLDAFRMANTFSVRSGGVAPFEVSLVGVRKKVLSAQGFGLPVQPIAKDSAPDWAIIPALGTGTPELLLPALERPDVKMARVQLLKWRSDGARLRVVHRHVSACGNRAARSPRSNHHLVARAVVPPAISESASR